MSTMPDRRRQTHTRSVTKAMLEHLARASGLRCVFVNTDFGWAWSVTMNGKPVFQGGPDEVYLWLQGFLRAVEEYEVEVAS